MKRAIGYQLLLNLALLAVFIVCAKSLSLDGLHERFSARSGHTYELLAEQGYVTQGDYANFIVFYPLYPLLIRMASWLFPAYWVSALVFSNLASVAYGALAILFSGLLVHNLCLSAEGARVY